MEWWLTVLIYVLVFLVGILAVWFLANLIFYRIPKIVKTLRFKKIYGRKPDFYHPLSNFQEKTLIMPKLKELATILNNDYADETNILNRMSAGKELYDDLKYEYLSLERNLKKSEKSFYNAIKAAEKCGFSLTDNYKDYLK